jgi:hypothetical protein
MLRRAVWYKLIDVSEMLTASIIKAMRSMMEAVSTSETSVNFYHIPEDKCDIGLYYETNH